MSQIEIIFIRHGEAANRWGDHPDPGLSDKGKMQSNNLLKHKELQHLEKYSFLSSPKLRAIETAKPLAKKFNKEVTIDDTFIEIPSDNIKANEKQKWLENIIKCKNNDLPKTHIKRTPYLLVFNYKGCTKLTECRQLTSTRFYIH